MIKAPTQKMNQESRGSASKSIQIFDEDDNLDHPSYANLFLLENDVSVPVNMKMEKSTLKGDGPQDWLF